MYSFSLVFTGCTVHSAHRSPFAPVATKNSDGMLAQWYMSSASSRLPLNIDRGLNTASMSPVSTTGLSGFVNGRLC